MVSNGLNNMVALTPLSACPEWDMYRLGLVPKVTISQFLLPLL